MISNNNSEIQQTQSEQVEVYNVESEEEEIEGKRKLRRRKPSKEIPERRSPSFTFPILHHAERPRVIPIARRRRVIRRGRKTFRVDSDESYVEDNKRIDNDSLADEDEDETEDIEEKDINVFHRENRLNILRRKYLEQSDSFNQLLTKVFKRSHMLKKFRPVARRRLLLEHLEGIDSLTN
jgi:hypothetical protein